MNDGRFPRLVLALVLVAFTLYAVADANALVMVPGVPLAILGWFVSRSRQGPMPRWVLTILVAGAIAYAAFGIGRDGLDVTDFCEFVVLIQLIKLFDKRTARDYAQLITLSTFLAIGAVLTSADFVPGMLLLLFLPLLVLTAMRFQFYAGRERDIEHARSLGVEPQDIRLRVRGLANLVALSLLGGAVVGGAVFVLVPRGLGAETFGNWTRTAAGARTGFTDTIRLGGDGLISESQQIVLDVSIEDPRGQTVGGPHEVYYLRGAALDRYEDGTWGRSESAFKKMPIEPGDSVPFGLAGGETVDIIQTITLRDAPRDRAYLFAAWKPSKVRFQQECDIRYDSATRTIQRWGDPGKFQYTVESVRQVRIPDSNYPPRREAVSFESDRIRELARDVLTRGRVDPDDLSVQGDRLALAARTIENFLRTEYSYSLQMRRPLDRTDPIEWFLFDSRVGHCEYFASAMAAMCRSVGIGARVVTGYVAAEWVGESNHYVVREANAHAWVEVEVKPNIWRTYDPTPPGDLIETHKPKDSILARINHLINAMEYVWIRSVVGFDESTRLSLLGGRDRDAGPHGRFDGGQAEPAVLITGRSIGSALVSAAIAFTISLAIGLLALVAIRLARTPEADLAWAGDQGDLRRAQARFFHALLRELRRLGVPRIATIPPLRHIEASLSPDSPARPPAVRLVRAYYSLRFGGRPLTPDELRDVERDLASLRALARTSENA